MIAKLLIIAAIFISALSAQIDTSPVSVRRMTTDVTGNTCTTNDVLLIMSTTPPAWGVCKNGVIVTVGSTSSGGTWGTITGAISAQSDLYANFSALSSSPNFSGDVTGLSFNSNGTTPQAMGLAAGSGSIRALAANSGGLSAPITGGTSYRWRLPQNTAVGFPLLTTIDNSRGVAESPITINKWLTGVTGSIGGSSITPGTPLSSTVTVTGAAVGDFCYMAPSTGALNASIIPYCFISATNTVTWYLQAQGASPVTPTAQIYNLRVN